ncbi:MAG: dihydrolipoyl dehydrogenase [Alphaproteobacteria bacterium]|nr:dihydrolipoyl dehydrogenase [Alphaproteobacteria bacterium]
MSSSPSHKQVDVAIIGAGTAGLTARRTAAQRGASVAIIDPGPYGTTCARVGCMPSKLLIAAADAAWHARHAGVFGVDATPVVDGPRVMARVQAERDRFVGFVLDSVQALQADGTLIRGRARFTAPHRLAVDPVDGEAVTSVEARTVVIATGSRPFTPPPFRGLGPDTLLTTDAIFELPDLPESVFVVGAGVIGMELGQALHRLGVQVTIGSIGGRIGFIQSREVNAEAVRLFRQELDLHVDYQLESVTPLDGGGARIRFRTDEGEPREADYRYVLMGAGRAPNWEGLGLEHAGLPLDARGRPEVNPYTNQVGSSHVFVAGDVAGHRPLLHEAADEGRMAGQNAAGFPHVVAAPRKTRLGIMFTDPQIAVVGEDWGDLHCDSYRVGVVDYGDQGRARTMNQHKGLVRIAGQAGTGLLVGAQMLGPRVEHTAHLLAWAIQGHMRVGEALEMPFYHPVFEEGIRTALRDLQGQLHLARAPGAPCEEFGPGT